jgi:plastocyanin
MITRLLKAVVLVILAGCSGSSPTAPPSDPTGGGTPQPAGAIIVGNDFFKSGHNGSVNQAVDTVAAGETVTWTWATGAGSHSIQSLGTPSFASSAIQRGSGSTYQVKFSTAGTYRYDCAVHGIAMTGRIVVQ